jgi:hypothetical protein
MLGNNVPDVERLRLLVNARQDPIIGSDEVVLVSRHEDRSPRGAHAWIDHHHMNRLRRKVSIRLPDRQRSIQNVMCQHAVCQVDDIYLGVDA